MPISAIAFAVAFSTTGRFEMYEVWVGDGYCKDAFYDAFKTYEEARACADAYNAFDDEMTAYVVHDQGD